MRKILILFLITVLLTTIGYAASDMDNVNVNGWLNVTNSSESSIFAGNVAFGQNVTITDTLTVLGTITGNVTASFDGSTLIPSSNNTQDIGTTTKYWSTLYVNIISAIGNITTSGWFKGFINASYIQNDNWLEDSQEGNLNVNSSDYWDNLGATSDINTADITDDNTYVTVIGDIMSGNLSNSEWFLGKFNWTTTDSWGSFDGSKFDFNETKLNATIDARSDFDTDTDTHIKGDDNYLYNDSDTMTFNITLAGVSLAVNSSDYWDNLGSPSDITGLDSTNIVSLNWTMLQNYPVACSAGYAITESGDSNVCTQFILASAEGDLNVNDSDYLDGIDSLSFLRSDATDTVSGAITASGIWQFTNSVFFQGNVTIVSADQTKVNKSINITDLSGATKIYLDATSDSWFNNGNVGIGDSTPEEMLDVEGNIELNNNNMTDVNCIHFNSGGMICSG